MIEMLAYRRPESLEALWRAFREAAPPAIASAGCTDLIPQSRAGKVPPATWIDLRQIPELTSFEIEESSLRLGACLTHHRVATHPIVRAELPALAQACASVGSRQIRNLGTLGGNAANASPAADAYLALVALDAEVILRGPDGTRTVAAAEFPQAPGRCDLSPGEIIEAFVIPRRAGQRSAFLKLGPRKAVAISKVSAAVSAVIRDGKLSQVRIALGAVGPTILRAPEAEAWLAGKAPDASTLLEVSRLVEKAVRPIDDPRSTASYRRHTAGVLARRALRSLLG